MNKVFKYYFLLLIILLVLTPFAVNTDLMNGVNKAKEFWFYGVSVLIIVSAVINVILSSFSTRTFGNSDCIANFFQFMPPFKKKNKEKAEKMTNGGTTKAAKNEISLPLFATRATNASHTMTIQNLQNDSNVSSSHSMTLSFPDHFILLYYFYIVIHILVTNPVMFNLNKFTIQTLFVVLYFVLKNFWNNLNKRDYKRCFQLLSIGLMLSGSIQAIIGLQQLYGFKQSYNATFQVTGTFINPAPFSFFLGAVFPFALAVYLKSKGDRYKIDFNRENLSLNNIKRFLVLEQLTYLLSIITLILILLILPVTMIRTSWFMVLAGSAYVVYQYYREKIKYFIKIRVYRISALTVAIILTVSLTTGAYLLKKDSADGRFLIWEITIDKIKDTPLFGQGYGSFYSQYNNWQADWFVAHPEEKEGPKAILAGNVNFAYNEFMEIVAELGLIGGVLFIVFLFSIIFSYKNVKNKNHLNIVFPSFLAILVGSLVSYTLYSLPTLILMLILITLIEREQKSWTEFNVILPVSIVGFILILVLLFLFVQKEYKRYIACKDLNYARYFMNSQDYEIANETFYELYPVLKNNGSFLQLYGKALSLNQQYEKSIEILQEASHFSNDIYLYTTLGDNHKDLGNYKQAEEAYQYAINMVPHKFYAPYLLAKLYHETCENKKAKKLAADLLQKPVKVESTAIKEIKQGMTEILAAGNPEYKAQKREKSSAKRKGAGSKEDV